MSGASCMGLADGRIMLFAATEDGSSVAIPLDRNTSDLLYHTLGTVLGYESAEPVEAKVTP